MTNPAPARRIEVVASVERAAPVEPAALGRRLDRGVLAAHLVGADRHVEPGAGRGEDVERRQRRLDQQHVGALGDVDRPSRAAPRGRWPGPSGSRAGRRTRAPSPRRRGTGRRTPRRSSRRRPGSPCPAWPAASSPARIAATWPSIIALGRDDVGAGLGLARPRSARAARSRRRCRPGRRCAAGRSARGRCTRTGRCRR